MVSVALMFVISAAIMAAAAGTLFREGVGLSRASQMIELLEPLAGSFAVSIFAIGIISAGVSSQFPNVLMLPWLILPITVGCIFYLSNRKDLMGDYKSGAAANLFLTVILLFSIFTSSIAIKGILQLLAG